MKNHQIASMALALIATTTPLAPVALAAPPAPVEIQAYGNGYGELSARWWQWALSIPAQVNPIVDTTGANCAQGQQDDVWFLAGTFLGAGPVTRTCTVPAGKPIFFPVANNLAFKPLGRETLLELRQAAAAGIDAVGALSATLDGVGIANLGSYRVRSPSFTVIAPPNGLLPPGVTKAPGNTDPLVSDGYWLLFPPLDVGGHVLTFHVDTPNGAIDVTYELEVK